jgi:ferrous iron transport protein A
VRYPCARGPSRLNVASDRRRATLRPLHRDPAHGPGFPLKLTLKTIFKNGTSSIMSSTLAEMPLGQAGRVARVDGARAFRRRLLEMGLVPGAEVRVVTIAPLGDPLRIEIRGGQWSIRRSEAAQIEIAPP